MICIYEVYKLILKYLTEELPEAFQHTFLYSVVLFIEYYLYRKKYTMKKSSLKIIINSSSSLSQYIYCIDKQTFLKDGYTLSSCFS